MSARSLVTKYFARVKLFFRTLIAPRPQPTKKEKKKPFSCQLCYRKEKFSRFCQGLIYTQLPMTHSLWFIAYALSFANFIHSTQNTLIYMIIKWNDARNDTSQTNGSSKYDSPKISISRNRWFPEPNDTEEYHFTAKPKLHLW